MLTEEKVVHREKHHLFVGTETNTIPTYICTCVNSETEANLRNWIKLSQVLRFRNWIRSQNRNGQLSRYAKKTLEIRLSLLNHILFLEYNNKLYTKQNVTIVDEKQLFLPIKSTCQPWIACQKAGYVRAGLVSEAAHFVCRRVIWHKWKPCGWPAIYYFIQRNIFMLYNYDLWIIIFFRLS